MTYEQISEILGLFQMDQDWNARNIFRDKKLYKKEILKKWNMEYSELKIL